MAIGSILGSVAGGLATAGGAALASNLFGPKPGASAQQFGDQARSLAGAINVPPINVPQIDTSGFSATLGAPRPQQTYFPGLGSQNVLEFLPDGSVNLGRNEGQQRTINALHGEGSRAAEGLTGLLADVRPGFGRLTDARVTAVDNARQRAIGDLKDNLARRRVSGSSFGRDQVLRGEREFADAEAAVRAQSFLEEMEATRQLLDQRFNVRQQTLQAEMDQFRFETELGATLAMQSRQQMEDARLLLGRLLGDAAIAQAQFGTQAGIAQTQAAVQAQSAGLNAGVQSARLGAEADAAAGQTFGNILQPALTSIGTGVQEAITRALSPPPAAPPQPV